MKNETYLAEQLRKLFRSQKLAVLATQGQGQPYTSLVAFAATDDLKCLVFATERATRKYANLASDARVAMMIDNRSNRSADFRRAVAVTATGAAREVRRKKGSRHLERLLKKHPSLEAFVTSPDCALMIVAVETYHVVARFQQVERFQP